MGQSTSISWESLVEKEARLTELLQAAQELKSVRSRRAHFCANSYWLVSLPGKLSYKQVVEKLVGDNLEAYKIVAEKIYYTLPDCKACFCPEIGLIPKNKRLIQIDKLFKILREGSLWHNKHPQDFDTLHEEAKPIFDKLEALGVSRTFSESVFIFGPDITYELLIQFLDKDEKGW